MEFGLMDNEGKKLVEKALRDQRPHERFNQALARVVSEDEKGKSGYKRYLELIDEIRSKAKDEDCSIEEAVKKVLGRT